MAYIRDISIILQKMQNEQLPFYRIKDSDNKTLIDQNDDPALGLDAAVDRLKNMLESLDGRVFVTISAKTGKEKASGGDTRSFTYNIHLGNGQSGSGIGSVSGQSNLDLIMKLMQENFNTQMQMLTQKMEDRQKLLDLERKIGETGKSDPLLLRAIDKLDRMIPDAPMKKPQPAAIHGTGDNQPKPFKKVEMNEEQQKKLNLAIHVLLEKDPEFIDNITMLAKLAQQDPDIYDIAIIRLKKLSS